MTGPSLVETDVHRRAEAPGFDADAERAQFADEALVQAPGPLRAPAAATNDGRRPLRTSPSRVNWETASTAPPASAIARFIAPSPSGKMRRPRPSREIAGVACIVLRRNP